MSPDEPTTHILHQVWEDTPAQREAAAEELRRMDLEALLGSGKPRMAMAIYQRLMWMAYPEAREALEEANKSDLERAMTKLRKDGIDHKVLEEEQEGTASAEPARLFRRCDGPASSGWSADDVRYAILLEAAADEDVLFFDWADDYIGRSSVHEGKHVFHEPQ